MAAKPLAVAVLGPGGVGGLVAALLSRAGDAVTVLAGTETTGALARQGLRLQSERFGDFTAFVRTAPRLEQPVDACFITVKATQLAAALERLSAGALGEGLVIPLLNGFEHVAILRSAYPPTSVVAATIRVESTRVEPGLIRQTSPFAAIELAPTAENLERVTPLAARLASTGLDVRLRDDEAVMLWDKFALLGPLALLTTHERANVGAVRTRRRDDALAAIAEMTAVAMAEGASIDPARLVRLMDAAPDSMETSMQRDQAAGRPLELDALGGAVLRSAARHHVPVPVIARLVGELQARTPGS
jgi:2-dehydropantoate 2-reductase